MSAPFWIFMAALAAICAWAFVSRSLLSHRVAKNAKAEEALNTRIAVFKDRVRMRNTRILEKEAADRGEKPVVDQPQGPSARTFYAGEDVAMKLREDHLLAGGPAFGSYRGHILERIEGVGGIRNVYAPVLRALGPIALIDNEEYELEYFARRFGLNAQDVRELIERRRSDPEAAMPAFLQKTRW